jgi:hypothetical protein
MATSYKNLSKPYLYNPVYVTYNSDNGRYSTLIRYNEWTIVTALENQRR